MGHILGRAISNGPRSDCSREECNGAVGKWVYEWEGGGGTEEKGKFVMEEWRVYPMARLGRLGRSEGSEQAAG